MSRLRAVPLHCLLALALASGLTLTAADSPTKEEWDPVVAAIAVDAADAESRIVAVTAAYPAWPGGWIEYARWCLAHDQAAEAWKHARQALTLDARHGDAAALGVQALSRLGRADDAIKVGAPFVGNRTLDKQSGGKTGYIAYYCAEAALAAGQTAKAEDLIKGAKASSGDSTPGAFHLLDARIAIAKNDLTQAEASLERAVAADPRQWDAWFELGRVRTALADGEASNGGKRDRLNKAVQAFSSVIKALPGDYESCFGLGRAKIGLARLDIDEGNEAGTILRDAVASLREAVERKPDLSQAWAAMGEALTRLERWDEAADALIKARDLGVSTRDVRNNLALALEKAGRIQEAMALNEGADTDGSSASELVGQAMGYYKGHRYRAAIERFRQAVEHRDLANDQATRSQILRFLGHAWREWATTTGTDGNAVPTAEEAETRLNAAAEAYHQAGDLGDHWARRHYAFLQGHRMANLAYAAGWTTLGWRKYLSTDGWLLVIGNYGASRAWANPLHYVIWGLLIGLPFILWIKSFFRRTVTVEEARAQARSSQKASTRAPTPPSANEGSSTIRPLKQAKPKEVSALTERKTKDGSRASTTKSPPAKASTRRREAQTETEEIPRPDSK